MIARTNAESAGHFSSERCPVSACFGRFLMKKILAGAVRTDADTSFVWVVRDGRARRTTVTTGRDFGEQVQVTSGLDGGETIVVGSPPALADGQAVATKG